MDLYAQIENALLEANPEAKCAAVAFLYENQRDVISCRNQDSTILPLDQPGQPVLPKLVDPRLLKRRSMSSTTGRTRMLHAFAHIEFNAINIALDAIYRFREMPESYIFDWLLVANEEALHFSLLSEYLQERGSFYGDCEAHRGLWDMVCKTRHDVLHRMAMVPRVMEARGLDVTPTMIERFERAGDKRAVEILQTIYKDEVGHVRIGNHWYQALCKQREVNPVDTFRQLVQLYLGGKLRGPFNWIARLEAGFEKQELQDMEQGFDENELPIVS